jgi:thiol:disulfide interchange protein DsbD
MALSMFGVYQLQVPAALQTKLAERSGRQASGKLAGVFVMGAISALIVGPCVAAPLAGALVYISQTRDVLVGGAALFSMAVGMSIPLLLVGVSAGSLLPRAGHVDGIGQALLRRADAGDGPVDGGAGAAGLVQMLLWAALLLGYGAYLLRGQAGPLGRDGPGRGLRRCSGATQLVGLASGGARSAGAAGALHGGAPAHQPLAFTRIKTVAELDAALAATGGKTAMLDFYADWCVSCKEMEKLTFVDPAVKARLAGTCCCRWT